MSAYVCMCVCVCAFVSVCMTLCSCMYYVLNRLWAGFIDQLTFTPKFIIQNESILYIDEFTVAKCR